MLMKGRWKELRLHLSHLKVHKECLNLITNISPPKGWENNCSILSIAAGIFKVFNVFNSHFNDRSYLYCEMASQLDVRGIDFATPLVQINPLAKQNYISIKVYAYQNKGIVYPTSSILGDG